MKIKSTRERLLASSMICGAALLGFAGSAAAQEAAGSEVQEIVVTGTRIPSPNLTSVSPVTAIGNTDIKAQGVTRVEDMINSLPQAFASQGATYSNGSTGTATVNLRGLGSVRTLVLIDGRRAPPGDPSFPASDLNFIPTPLIERVDILTGGASATYGADAVAGVVNFIMLHNFEGVRIDGQYSIYQHHNDSPIANLVNQARAGAAVPEFFNLPDTNIWDGESSEVALVLGVNAPDNKGNITAYASFRHDEPILAADRDFSSCTLFSGTPDFSQFGCGGSGTAFPARVGSQIVDPAGPGNTFRTRTGADVYNFGPLNYFLRPDDRYSLGAFAHYEIAPWATAYADVMFMDDRSTYQIAPGGIFAGTFNINCANPLLSAQQRGLMPATAATGGGTCASNPAGTFRGIVARRNIEGGPRQGDTRHTDYRIVVGLRGDLNDNWSYDGYLQYGSVNYQQKQTGFFRTEAINNSLNVVTDPATGQPVCASVLSGTDTACVPYNIFQLGAVTRAALDYLETPSFNNGNIQERVASIAVTGQLADYGVKSPWASEGVGVAFGAEYRREHLDFAADFVAASGALNGSGGASPPVDGGFDVYELFGEARIPLIEDMPFAKRVQLELGYRFSDYSSINTTHTYKVAGDWEVIDGLRFRAGYNRAVRAPNVLELFSPQNVVLDGSTDPCAGLAPTDPTVARCAQAFGLTTAQVLAIEENPANQYNGLTGGNPNLDPETADTWSVGVVYQPSFIPGLNVSLDWFDIKVEDYISGIGADLIISRCVDTLDPFFCGLVHRDTDHSIWLSPQGFIQDTTLNTGSLATSGLDINAGYRTDLDTFGLSNAGGLSLSFVGTWLDKLETVSLPGDPAFDCKGLYGTICGTPNPEWRHKLRVTWQTPFSYGDWIKSLSLSAQWRYFSEVTLDAFDADPALNNPGIAYESDRVLGSRSYLDLSASWTLRDNVNFRLGVNNVLDKDPPLTGSSNCPTGPCNNNTWPQVYDALGRYVFFGLTADF